MKNQITDKELENVIYCCGIELDCKDCPFYHRIGHSLCIEHKRDAAKAYIERLKAESGQALTEFADFLKDYARQVQENGYDGIGANDIDEKLKEFLNK